RHGGPTHATEQADEAYPHVLPAPAGLFDGLRADGSGRLAGTGWRAAVARARQRCGRAGGPAAVASAPDQPEFPRAHRRRLQRRATDARGARSAAAGATAAW